MATKKQSGDAVDSDSLYLLAAQNLADVDDVQTSRDNLGLGDLDEVLAGKANLIDDVVEVAHGGTGAKTKDDAWAALAKYGTTSDTAAQGNDSRLNTLEGKAGGNISSGCIINGGLTLNKTVSSELNSSSEIISSAIYTGTTERARTNLYVGVSSAGERVGQLQVGQDGTNKTWIFTYSSGSATAPGSWVNGSDERHKSNITVVPNSLEAVMSWRGCTYDKLDGDTEVGLIAQDVEKFCPTAVINTGRREFSTGLVIEDFKSLNTQGVAAAYHTEAIKALFSLVEQAIVDPDKALASIDAIKAALIPAGDGS